MTQCIAITKKGSRCGNKGKGEFKGLCKRHFYLIKPPPTITMDKLEKVVKVGGGFLGVISGMIKIIELLSPHWDKIRFCLHFRLSSFNATPDFN